ncbi:MULTISPECIES: ABC transporter permease [unclassified Ruegeria]|uniref:ABC transporter permease n=1 Tax=unclassified Ruegeria TaxID=2625375 RepID=UPI0014890336|nr:MULTISPECIES: ABC transporter permease [unclassified Ruegeria]NOD75134.1 ABC transporter permease subunit [Ruegeria sp. HKCCD4332]NOD87095.1 ABC transporter permease subunit [Ruegeria sp. HKCCD4318]NOD91207.1 ABC transporter permease subunit [Ruegeria sp. HKCCD4884]NOE12650.1 ABC transporter permease subunit [Ruegeria sp. HKCCD4318-2]NOG09185.1 ABC transporter permease [Ruegeria sp. HKCCD4315]
MQGFASEFSSAIALIFQGDSELWAIVLLSLKVSMFAVLISALIGMPVGAALAVARFPGRRVLIVLMNALMGFPPVVVGLLVYLMLSRSGPLGVLELLYTPTAMIIAQVVLVTPIVAALTRQVIEMLAEEYSEQLRSLGVSRLASVPVLLWDARLALVTALLAGFGRAIAEVGAVIIVGGNINHVTRVMTTTIALETSKGNLALALALGAILIGIAVAVNAMVSAVSLRAEQEGLRHA